jgi:hypothetical protein
MSIGMIIIMMTYNLILTFGLSTKIIILFISSFPAVFIGCMLIEQLIVDHNVKKIHRIIVNPDDSRFKKTAIFTLLMVTGMCSCMTLYTSLLNFPNDGNFLHILLIHFARNYPAALISQFFIVGPLIKFIFRPSNKKTAQTELSKSC